MASSIVDDFTVISTKSTQAVAPDFEEMNSAKSFDFDITFVKSLREHFPKLSVTVVNTYNAPLLTFADVEPTLASYVLDIETDAVFRRRTYGWYGELGETRVFAKYIYRFEDMQFIVFIIPRPYETMQYILKEPDTEAGETPMSTCAATDALIRTIGLRFEDHSPPDTKYVYLFEHGYWYRSKALWNDIHASTWEKVILAPKLKKDLTGVTSRFFDSKDIYKRYGVQWKRGLILYGPPGNGKTISIKALMRDLAIREPPIASLYVQTATDTYDIEEVFSFARYMAPCLLVLEDVDSIVTKDTRSYFFNEIDGLANNDGIMMAASTNFINKLDPGLASRPSRFDRKFRFPLPNVARRVEYARFWRKKLEKRAPSIDFPESLLRPMAQITGKFSFAFMQEAFIASLLQMARDDEDDGGDDDSDDDMSSDTAESDDEIGCADLDGGLDVFSPEAEQLQETSFYFKDGKDADPLDKYHLWRAFKVSVEVLRKDLQHKNDLEFHKKEEDLNDEDTGTVKCRTKQSVRSANDRRDFFHVRPTDERIVFVPSKTGGKWTVQEPGRDPKSRDQLSFAEARSTYEVPQEKLNKQRMLQTSSRKVTYRDGQSF